MTLDQAFEHAMSAVLDLREEGIRVETKPSRSRNNPETVLKYKDRLRVDLWNHVVFFPSSPEQSRMISQKAKELGWRGITFDVGGCCGQRDWEIDWSLRCTDTPDGEREMQMDTLEEIIEDELEGGSPQHFPLDQEDWP